MRIMSVAVAIAALMLVACSDDEHAVNKSRPISNTPSTPSTVLESMSGDDSGDQVTDTAMDAAKDAADDATEIAKEATDVMDKAEEVVVDAEGEDLMDKAKEMAEDSGVMDKSEEMVADVDSGDLMDKAEEMAEESGVMDGAKEMIDDAGGSDIMEKAGGLLGGAGVEEAEEVVEEVTDATSDVSLATVSMEDGTALAKKSGCFACHSIERKVLGPGWNDVAAMYADDKAAGKAHLLNKVAKGGKGVWTEITGGTAMPPYSPRVSDENIETLVDFILGL